jgi:hypothetical protein
LNAVNHVYRIPNLLDFELTDAAFSCTLYTLLRTE